MTLMSCGRCSSTATEAVLLSDSYQWLYVSPRSTSWATWQFGIGGRKLWFNGHVNINIETYEDPDEYYGTHGFAGSGGDDDGIAGAAGAY
jgi:hypothetical protein